MTPEQIDRRLDELLRSQVEAMARIQDLQATWERHVQRQRRRIVVSAVVGLLVLWGIAVACLWVFGK